MSTVTVSDKGHVVIPADIRRRLGITPGCQLDFTLEENVIHVELRRAVAATRPEVGYGMRVCKKAGKRRLSDFDLAAVMREAADDRG